MDYSLLVGVHFRETSEPQETEGYSLTLIALTGFFVSGADSNVFFFLSFSFTTAPSEVNNSVEAAPRPSRADMDQFLCDFTKYGTSTSIILILSISLGSSV